MIRRPVTCRPQPRSAPTPTPPPGPGRHLTQHWPAVPRHARQAARRSSPERTAPAIAGSRNARTGKARQPGSPGLPGTPRRPRARTDHMSHSSPTTCRPLPGPGPPTTHTDYSPRQPGFPARPFARPPGTTARPRAGLRRRPPSSRLGHVALRRATRPTPGPGLPREYHQRVPSTDTEPPLPGQIQAGSPMRGPRSKTARNTSKRTLPARLNPTSHPDRTHHRGRRVNRLLLVSCLPPTIAA